MHGKGEFAKNNGSICNTPIKTAYICNVLPRTADSSTKYKVESTKF